MLSRLNAFAYKVSLESCLYSESFFLSPVHPACVELVSFEIIFEFGLEELNDIRFGNIKRVEILKMSCRRVSELPIGSWLPLSITVSTRRSSIWHSAVK